MGSVFCFRQLINVFPKRSFVAYLYFNVDGLRDQKSNVYPGIRNSWEIYEKYWRPFGELLTSMEREGFKIDINHMQNIENQAKKKVEEKKKKFMSFLM